MGPAVPLSHPPQALHLLAEIVPQTIHEIGAMPGVGVSKQQKYGRAVHRVIQRFLAEHSLLVSGPFPYEREEGEEGDDEAVEAVEEAKVEVVVVEQDGREFRCAAAPRAHSLRQVLVEGGYARDAMSRLVGIQPPTAAKISHCGKPLEESIGRLDLDLGIGIGCGVPLGGSSPSVGALQDYQIRRNGGRAGASDLVVVIDCILTAKGPQGFDFDLPINLRLDCDEDERYSVDVDDFPWMYTDSMGELFAEFVASRVKLDLPASAIVWETEFGVEVKPTDTPQSLDLRSGASISGVIPGEEVRKAERRKKSQKKKQQKQKNKQKQKQKK